MAEALTQDSELLNWDACFRGIVVLVLKELRASLRCRGSREEALEIGFGGKWKQTGVVHMQEVIGQNKP